MESEEKIKEEIIERLNYDIESQQRAINDLNLIFKKDTLRERVSLSIIGLFSIIIFWLNISFYYFTDQKIVSNIIYAFKLQDDNTYFTQGSLIFLAIFAGLFVFVYLRYKDKLDIYISQKGILRGRIYRYENRIASLLNIDPPKPLDEENHSTILGEVIGLSTPLNVISKIFRTIPFEKSVEDVLERAKIQAMNAQEMASNAVAPFVQESFKTSVNAGDLFEEFKATKLRLTSEIKSLNTRGILNLSIGTFTTMIGLGVLVTALTSNQTYGDKTIISSDFVGYYITRIATVIFIEVFAFFFLRQYRTSLLDIKYYQNELTNIESKFLALSAALATNHEDIQKQAITEFIKTERNAIVTTDQTNLVNSVLKSESERDRYFTDNVSTMLDSFTRFYKETLNKKEKSNKIEDKKPEVKNESAKKQSTKKEVAK